MLQQFKLPLVDSIIASYQGKSFSNVKIIGVQHVLETTYSMNQSLYRLGLKPENVSILGKCYSTRYEIYQEMLEDKIDVCSRIFAYNSYEPFDVQYDNEVAGFFSKRMEQLIHGKFDCIIVLDDGGKCINFLHKHLSPSILIVAIEQTSSGY